MLVISHDRYFLERVCDTFVGLLGDGELRDLPGGIEQYLELRARSIKNSGPSKERSAKPSILEVKALKKEVARLEREIARVDEKISALEASQTDVAFDHQKLADVMKELAEAHSLKSELEDGWLQASDKVEESNN